MISRTSELFLAVDIGNTTITMAALDGLKPKYVRRLDTINDFSRLQKSLRPVLRSFRRHFPSINKTIICSVVPSVTKLIEPIVNEMIGPSLIIGKDLMVPMVNRYRNPRQVGQDRLVCAYAVRRLFGTPAIVIDLGTAITFDAISANGEYLGGAIVPGIRLSAESLHKKTALLPKIRIQAPKAIIGKTTQESMRSGIFFGFGALCSGMIGMIGKKFSHPSKIILTGGHAALMRKYIFQKIDQVDEDLVFKGIALLAQTKRNYSATPRRGRGEGE